MIMPKRTNKDNKLRMLKKVDIQIHFVVEEKRGKHATLPRHANTLHRMQSKILSVQKTNKYDYIHYLIKPQSEDQVRASD